MTVHLEVFGDFGVIGPDGRRRELSGIRQRALLGYLALIPRHEAGRSHLAQLLWPDAPASEARHSLRQCLSLTRRALGDAAAAFTFDAERVGLIAATCAIDAERFQTLAASTFPADWQAAAELYAGEPLAGLDLGGTPFDDWLTQRRRVFADAALSVYGRLAEWQTRSGDAGGALATLRRSIALDPFDDGPRRRLMQVLVDQGRTTAAIREYRDFVQLLRTHLAVEPAPETARLYQAVMASTETSDDDARTLETYAQALEQLPDCIIVTDLETRIVGFSRLAERSFGLRKADVLGKTPAILHREAASCNLPLLLTRRALQHGCWTETVRLTTSAGVSVPMRRSVVTLRTPAGRAIGAFGMTSA